MTQPPKSIGDISLRTTVGLAVSTLIVVCGFGWHAKGVLDDFDNKNDAHFAIIEASQKEMSQQLSWILKKQWSIADMKDWAYVLDRNNRDVQRFSGQAGLTMPEIKPAN